jgi:iron complex outermembrane recepter protein
MKIRVLILSLFASSFVFADDVRQLSPTVVTATRVETNSFDLPVSIDVVGKENIQDAQLGMTLSESLIRVPGLTAQNRTQLAQDPQISSRGYGARSAFGVRGIRLFVDGIPLTTPDGIAQPGNVDLETIKAIEVMRGPFSTLYGSSSGGVIQLITDIPKKPEIGFNFLAGSFGTQKASTHASGETQGVSYLLNLSHFETDGYRQNSAATKDQITTELKFNMSNATKVNILIDYFDSKAQDPLGLARNDGFDKTSGTTIENTPNKYYSAFINPKAAPDVAFSANTRVERTNTQAGLNLEHILNDNNSLKFIGSLGQRDNLQYLALPVLYSDKTNLTRGRASKIARDFWSSELTWTNKGEIFSKKYSITSGLNYGYMSDDRFDIDAKYGEKLAFASPYTYVNRNETDTAKNFDQFVQGKFEVLENADIHAGVRHSKIDMDFKSKSEIKSGNSIKGSISFEKTTPVVGIIWKTNPSLNFYANYGKGFETPTLIEMAFNSTTSATGPNLNLKPSSSDNYEVGMKSFIGNNTKLNAALFMIDTKQEIIIASNSTYSVYGNAAQTKREGFELSLDSQFQNNFGLYGAYTYLDATFDTSYSSGIGGQVNKGNKIPGTYKQQLYGEISWKYPDLNFKTALEGRVNSKVYINDVNSDAAPGYAIANIRAGFDQTLSNWKFGEYLKIENIFDKSYIGSVRVNDNQNRNFEPSPGRNYLVGVKATYQF